MDAEILQAIVDIQVQLADMQAQTQATAVYVVLAIGALAAWMGVLKSWKL
jgi:hypothetical protein